ncbi:acyltransferase family protein [Enterococcus sp. RIT-PI-f]|uniref:acyltransferase family protein n=1 Tax=Enterococcus sp. RIT-PI-f TaxID=1690244 RepID=UPI003FA41CFF
MLPYFFINLIFLLPKILYGSVINDSINFSLIEILGIFFTPRLNVWGHTWFLFCLFIVFTLQPIWKFFLSKPHSYWFISTFFIIMSIFPINIYFLTISDLMKNLIFFWIGMLTYRYNKLIFIFLDKWFKFLILIAFALSAIYLYVNDSNFVKIICSLSIIYVLYMIPTKVRITNLKIDWLARNSFLIYLLHWPIMLFTREILLRFNLPHNYIIICMIFTGFLGPILLIYLYSKYFISRKKIT